MVLQAITNVRATLFQARKSVVNYKLIKGKTCAVGMELRGETMYDFLSKLVEMVMPRIKEWKGVSAASGDSNGNISWGLDPDVVGMFPEVEVNYDS